MLRSVCPSIEVMMAYGEYLDTYKNMKKLIEDRTPRKEITHYKKKEIIIMRITNEGVNLRKLT